MPESVREQVLAQIQSVFANAVPADSTHGTTWGKVMDVNYEASENKGKSVMAVLEGDETYIDVVSPDKRDRELEITLDTRAYISKGTSMRTGANRVLADIEEIVEANNLWGNLAYSTVLTANSIDREDAGDRTANILVFMAVRYRSKRSDPNSRT